MSRVHSVGARARGRTDEPARRVVDERAQPLVHAHLVVSDLVNDRLQHDDVAHTGPLEQVNLVQHHVRVKHDVGAAQEPRLEREVIEVRRACRKVVAEVELPHKGADLAAARPLDEDAVHGSEGLADRGHWGSLGRQAEAGARQAEAGARQSVLGLMLRKKQPGGSV